MADRIQLLKPDDADRHLKPNNRAGLGTGTMVQTQDGAVPVDWLTAGDRVLTLDRGFQPIRWIGRTAIPARRFEEQPALRPVVLPAGWLGKDDPATELLLGPGHRVLLSLPELELYFGTHQALAHCDRLIDPTYRRAWSPPANLPFAYYLILLDQHDLIRAEGLWVETLLPLPAAMAALDTQSRNRIENVLGSDAVRAMKSARYVLDPHECAVLRLNDRHAAGALARTGHWQEVARYGSKSA